jgi:hypothetical protein
VQYKIRQATANPAGWKADGSFPVWSEVAPLSVSHFLPESSPHRPQTLVRLVYDTQGLHGQGLHGQFHVEDRFVRCVRTEYGSEVWKDSCVEYFVEPKPGRGYFNFEFNSGGAFLVNHIVDPPRTADGFKEFVRLPESITRPVKVRSSLPAVSEPEITEAVTWTLEFFIPFTLLENYVGRLGEVVGQTWRGNFFKCAEENSHPHWAAWSPVDEFNFHRPHCFGKLLFV